MDFGKTLVKDKWFNVCEIFPNDETGARIHLAYFMTHQEFMIEREEVFKKFPNEEDPGRMEALYPLVGKHLVLGWEGFTFNGDDLPFTRQNACELMKDDTFRLLTVAMVFNREKFIEPFKLNLELVLKNSKGSAAPASPLQTVKPSKKKHTSGKSKGSNRQTT